VPNTRAIGFLLPGWQFKAESIVNFHGKKLEVNGRPVGERVRRHTRTHAQADEQVENSAAAARPPFDL